MQKRNHSIDILRIICCFLVICIHTSPLYIPYSELGVSTSQKMILLSLESFVRVGMPIFFAISGMFILNKDILSLSSFYKKRIVSIIIPFIVASVIHYIVAVKINGGDISFNAYVNLLLTPTGIGEHFWFVYAILGIYIASPLFNAIVSKADEKSAISSLYVIVLLLVIHDYVSPFIKGVFIPDFSIWLLYFISGGLITKIRSGFKCYAIFSGVGYAMTIIASYLNYKGVLYVNLMPYDSGINMYIFAVASLGMFYSLRMTFGNLASRFIQYVSSTTYMIYLLHICVQMIISKILPTYWYVGNAFIYTLSMSALIMLVSLLCSIIINTLVVDRISNPIIRALEKPHNAKFN
ncbi:acyltransferase [Citrobacter portucalensis]|uniref:acyltransferase n=1 Tax=Citrobacter portucalensis TaxID=1639133 RepID=UPI0011DE34CB|nr:acyltransferase [Citrobacter portucalensis]QEH55812.1 acyltransferase [Citrobacter portucalensis]